jgi:hypothetical protein
MPTVAEEVVYKISGDDKNLVDAVERAKRGGPRDHGLHARSNGFRVNSPHTPRLPGAPPGPAAGTVTAAGRSGGAIDVTPCGGQSWPRYGNRSRPRSSSLEDGR